MPDEAGRPSASPTAAAIAAPAPQIRGLVDGGALQLSLFDERDMAAITSPDYRGERADRVS